MILCGRLKSAFLFHWKDSLNNFLLFEVVDLEQHGSEYILTELILGIKINHKYTIVHNL